MARDPFDHVAPGPLMDDVRKLTEFRFRAEHGATPFLAIRIRPTQLELAAALDASQKTAVRVPAKPVAAIGFHTDLVELPLINSIIDAQAAVLADSAATIAQALSLDQHYVVPLAKRKQADSAFVDRISVGRAQNTDVILRDKTVSKYHAYFQIDKLGSVSVIDAGSKNGTSVSGEKVPPRGAVDARIGARVVFGSVESLLLDATSLWRALRAV